MTATATATIDQLKPGHEYPGASVNSRVANRQADIDQLAASIKNEGLLLPIIVVPAPKGEGFYVVDGNRRRAAIEQLVKFKEFPKTATWDIRIEKDLDAASALRKSLAANMHVPLHPVDQYETFAATIDKESPAAIAERYALTEKVVKQRLQLGRMSAAVRKAWRDGKISREAAEAYATTNDHERQERFLKRGTWESKQPHQIRNAMVGDQDDVAQYMKFVGEDAYKAAGGALTEDLFGEKPKKFADIGLLERLAKEKIKAKIKEYIDAGWGWAAMEGDGIDHSARYWEAKKSPSAEEKKKLGVVMWFDYDGSFKTKTGISKSGSAKGTSARDEKKKAKPTGALSNSLKQDLQKMLAYATKDALAADKHPSEQSQILAKIVADQITPERIHGMPHQVANKLDAIRDRISAKVMADALAKRFDAKRFFAGAPKPVVIKAIAEAGFAEDAKKLNAGTKAAAWKWALARLPKTGWLPTALRTKHYSGPGAAKKKAA